MALLSASNLSKSFGTDVVLTGASFEIQENDRVGLVGVNGSGKTTLFKMLTGELPFDDGNIYQAKETVLGYMEQHLSLIHIFSLRARRSRASCAITGARMGTISLSCRKALRSS